MTPHDFIICLVLNSCNNSDLRLKLLELDRPLTLVAIQERSLAFEAQNFLSRAGPSGIDFEFRDRDRDRD